MLSTSTVTNQCPNIRPSMTCPTSVPFGPPSPVEYLRGHSDFFYRNQKLLYQQAFDAFSSNDRAYQRDNNNMRSHDPYTDIVDDGATRYRNEIVHMVRVHRNVGRMMMELHERRVRHEMEIKNAAVRQMQKGKVRSDTSKENTRIRQRKRK